MADLDVMEADRSFISGPDHTPDCSSLCIIIAAHVHMSFMAPHLTSLPVSSRRGLDDLAWAIDRDGIAAHQRRGASPSLARPAAPASARCSTNVLLDDALPGPVRERAFGQLAMWLAHAPAAVVAMAA